MHGGRKMKEQEEREKDKHENGKNNWERAEGGNPEMREGKKTEERNREERLTG